MSSEGTLRAIPADDHEAKKPNKITEETSQIGVALSASETVSRYGSASAEYIKGYSGIDNETGTKLAKGLKGISEGKIHPDYAKNNIKQQAGYSAEVAATSRDNAEAIIKKSSKRTMRGDDHPNYGKNHTVVDRVQVLDGKIIAGSESQMKFVGNRDQLFNDITKLDGKFSRYRGIKLELPSEQFEGAAEFCKQKAEELRSNALRVEQEGKTEIAQKLREEAKNYDQLAENVVDSGLTTKDAIFYREHPKIATALDIGRTSHRAGMEGAKYGSLIGGSISLLTNAFAVAQEKKQFDEAARDVLIDVGKSAVVGYGTAFAGTAIKGLMQQSSNHTVRALSKTNVAVLALNTVLELRNSIKRYMSGEIDEAQLLEEIGQKGAGMLSSAMMSALGQLVIPIPFVGAAVGGMIGYTLSSLFYQSALDAAKRAEAAKANLVRVRAIEIAARAELEAQRAAFDAFIRREFKELVLETRQLFAACENGIDIDIFAMDINSYAELLGAQLQFKSQMEFDAFMADPEGSLRL